MLKKQLTVAWISDFPIEWLSEVPETVRKLPRRHPATWMMVLLSEFEKDPSLRIHVIVLRGRIEKSFSFERNGTVFHVLKAQPKARLASLFWLDSVLIKKVCRKISPDLVHAWGIEKGAPLIAHRMSYPYLMTVQGLLGWYKERFRLAPYDRFLEPLERRSFKRAPVVTTESNFSVAYLRERYPRLKIQQAEHAPNRVFSQIRRSPETKPVHFVSIGSLDVRKGTDLLFEALSSLQAEIDFKLTMICGANPAYLAPFQARLPKSFWERVEIKHDVLPHEVAEVLAGATMLLLPTRADTSPNAVKEAVVAGIPVVASNVGGIPDYVIPNKNGILFNAGSLEEFKASIRAACKHPLFREGKVDMETLARMQVYLSPERMAENFLKAYQMAIEAGRG